MGALAVERIAKAIVAVACLAFIGAGLTLGWPKEWLYVGAIGFFCMAVMV